MPKDLPGDCKDLFQGSAALKRSKGLSLGIVVCDLTPLEGKWGCDPLVRLVICLVIWPIGGVFHSQSHYPTYHCCVFVSHGLGALRNPLQLLNLRYLYKGRKI